MKQVQLRGLRLGIVAVLTMVALSFVASEALAQPDPVRMKERVNQRVDGAMEALALEGDKAITVREILQSGADKQLALMSEVSGGQGGFAGMREKRAVIDKEVEAQLTDVLTKEELATYKKYLESQQANRRGGRRRDVGDQ